VVQGKRIKIKNAVVYPGVSEKDAEYFAKMVNLPISTEPIEKKKKQLLLIMCF